MAELNTKKMKGTTSILISIGNGVWKKIDQN